MAQKLSAFLQHGQAGQSMSTEAVEVREAPMPHHKAGLSFTASGYGSRIPTEYMVKWRGRWRRVYCRIFSNVGTHYIRQAGAENGRIVCSLYREG